MTDQTAPLIDAEPPLATASFEHLTGRDRGTISWISQPDIQVTLSSKGSVHFAPAEAGEPAEALVARLHQSGESYEMEVVDDRQIWLNGRAVKSGRLEHGDMVEFCENGPMSRYSIYGDGLGTRRTVSGILADAVSYIRTSRQPVLPRFGRVCRQIALRLATETTLFFRGSVILTLLVLAVLMYQQSRINTLLREQIESGTAQREEFSKTLARAREEALVPGDLESLRRELSGRLESTAERVRELERLSEASARIIAASIPSIVFLQGAYGFKETESGRYLRQVLDEEGRPRLLPGGLPHLSLEGEGPIAERQFTGTGFEIEGVGFLVTNRHVGVPWEIDGNLKLLSGQGLEPELIKFIAYRPGVVEPEAIELVAASDADDLALLRYVNQVTGSDGLKLTDEHADPGDDIIVLGYPTGLRSILAQSGRKFIESLQEEKITGFWEVASRLSKSNRIVPLASQGIIGRTTEQYIVYDAETTHGGSGGPVLDTQGRVVAVNTAILPEFGGSNLGVPAERVSEFLHSVQEQHN